MCNFLYVLHKNIKKYLENLPIEKILTQNVLPFKLLVCSNDLHKLLDKEVNWKTKDT